MYIYEYYSVMGKEILPFATPWMDLEGIMLSVISQTEKDKYCILLTCGIEKRRQTLRNRVEKWLPVAQRWGE